MDPFIWWKKFTPKTRAEWYRDHRAKVVTAEAPVPTPGPVGQPSGTSASSSSGVDRAPTPAPGGSSSSGSGAQVADPGGVSSASVPPPVAPALCCRLGLTGLLDPADRVDESQAIVYAAPSVYSPPTCPPVG